MHYARPLIAGSAAVITAILGATDGTLKFSYSDSTGQLITLTGGDLHFYDVRGCAGLFNDNDPLTISGAFPLSPKQQITSP